LSDSVEHWQSTLALTQINLCHMVYDLFVCELVTKAIQSHSEV
jgi:hypothetical protein